MAALYETGSAEGFFLLKESFHGCLIHLKDKKMDRRGNYMQSVVFPSKANCNWHYMNENELHYKWIIINCIYSNYMWTKLDCI